HRPRPDRCGPGADGVAERLRQDHRNAVTVEPAAGSSPPAPAATRVSRKPKRRALATRLTRSPLLVQSTAAMVRGFVRLIERMGRHRAERLALKLVAWLAPVISQTRIARRNLALPFPEERPAALAAILRGSSEKFARV